MDTRRMILSFIAALLLAAFAVLWVFGSNANTQTAGPTTQDCYSARFHAATDCDRLTSLTSSIAITGNDLHSPTALECYSARFPAATDCDRLVSGWD